MINIYELLKDCPTGTKLYCTMCDVVALQNANNRSSLIYATDVNANIWIFDCNGRVFGMGECDLFPSKENRDWSKFKAPQPLPEAGELCWTMTSVGNWVPRYATGSTASSGMPLFFCNQSKKGESNAYVWHKWCDFNELINEK